MLWSLYELCQASQLVLLPTSPKISSRREGFLFWTVSEGRGMGGGLWYRLWAQGGVGGFGYDRAIFPDSLSWFLCGAWKWTYCNWHESFPCYWWFGTTTQGKHACCGRQSNSILLLVFALSFRTGDYMDAGWKNSLFKMTQRGGKLRPCPLVFPKCLLCLFFFFLFVRVKLLNGSLLIKSQLSGLCSVAQSPFTSPAVSWDTFCVNCTVL